jgi:hypothetical protein
MGKLGRVASIIAAFIVALPDFAGPANAWEPAQLTDTQLDKVTAGLSASGTGTGTAQGMLSSSIASVTTAVGAGGGSATAVGRVTSSASSTTSGIVATASSTLSLIVVIP